MYDVQFMHNRLIGLYKKPLKIFTITMKRINVYSKVPFALTAIYKQIQKIIC